jgi:hypothetical protein
MRLPRKKLYFLFITTSRTKKLSGKIKNESKSNCPRDLANAIGEKVKNIEPKMLVKYVFFVEETKT